MNVSDILESGLLELYALDGLSATERAQVEAWAAQYPVVKSELTVIENGLEKLALAQATPVRPSLKDAILSKIETEKAFNDAQKTPEEPKAETHAPQTPLAETPEIAHRVIIPDTPLTKKISTPNVLPWFLSAALAISSFYYYNELQKERAKTQNCETLQRQNAKSYVENDRALNILKNTDTKTVELKGLKIAPDSKVNIYWNAQKAETVLSIVSLPTPPENTQYQLWAIVDKKPVSAGVLDYNTEALQFMRGFDKAQAFAITLEKKGGSDVPTLDKMYVLGTL